jgi:hypothetical protein
MAYKSYKKSKTSTAKEPKEQSSEPSFVIAYTDDPGSMARRILVAGRSKSGRTRFALTFPKPLVIDVDKGLSNYQDKHVARINVEPGIRTHTFMLDLLGKLKAGDAPFDKANAVPETLVIDDLTGLSEQYEREIVLHEPATDKGKERGDGLFLQDYSTIQNRFVSLLTEIKDVPVKYIVVIASIYSQTDDELEGYFETPQVTGKKFPPRVPTYFDEVYYTEYSAEHENWILRIRPTKRFPYAGTKCGIKEDIFEDPSYGKLKKYYEKKK